MSELQRNPKSSEDEIDLTQLFSAIGSFFNSIGNSVVSTIVRIKRRSIQFKWIIIIGGVLGIILSQLYYTAKPIYSSSMLLRSEYFNGRIVDNRIEKLNLLCGDKDRIGLSNALGIDKEVAL